MFDFVSTLLLLLVGVIIGSLGMRIIWLMSLEEKDGMENADD